MQFVVVVRNKAAGPGTKHTDIKCGHHHILVQRIGNVLQGLFDKSHTLLSNLS